MRILPTSAKLTLHILSNRRIRALESTTVITLLLPALERVKLQAVFDCDPYESRRTALPGARLVKVLVIHQLLSSATQRGLLRAIEEQPTLQAALGGELERNTLSNALRQRDLDQMVEAWLRVLQTYQPWINRLGKKFARLAVVDATLIKLSLQAFTWAEYRQQSGAAKLHAVYEWARGIAHQMVVTTGKVADLKAAWQFAWSAHWTYLFDRGYLGFDLLTTLLEAKAHFVVRLKRGVNYRILQRFTVPAASKVAGIRLRSDWTVSLSGWDGVVLRLVSYQLPDGKLIRVLTDRFDLSALSVAQLYKERWAIENWWRWIKQMFKIKQPLGRSEQALPVQIVGAFITDLLLRAFEHSSGFTSGLYEFVTRCQEMSQVPIEQLTKNSDLRKALEAVAKLLDDTPRHFQLAA